MRPYRREMISREIRDIVSDAIAHRLQDPRISPLTTITRVELTKDMETAKVYISVIGKESDERKSIAGIQHATGHIQRAVAAGLTMRQCPKLKFLIDEGVKASRVTMEILAQNLRENPSLAEPPETPEGDTDDTANQPDKKAPDLSPDDLNGEHGL